MSENSLTAAEDKRWSQLAHLLGILGIVPPLAIYLAVRQRADVARIESKESLNWQLTGLIVGAIGTVALSVVALVLAGIGLSVDSPALVAATPYVAVTPAALVALAVIAFSVIGFLRVRTRGSYRYPFTIRLVK